MFGSLTPEQKDSARKRLGEYACIRPDVVTLATLASLARRIEPELLRALRLALSNRFSADYRPTVATEAALWFSPFIESRGPDNITLLPEFSQLLQERLRADQGLLEAANDVIKNCHQLISPVIRWEEELVYLSLNENTPESERKHIFEQNIWRVIKAISKDNRPSLEEWVVEMGNRLPDTANLNPLLAQLRNLSTMRILRRDSLPSNLNIHVNLAELDFSNIPTVVLDVLKIGNDFRIGYLFGSGQFGIRIPDIQPITIDLLQFEDSNDATSSLVIMPGGSIDIPIQPNPVRIRTIDGQIYSLDPNLFEGRDLSERNEINESFRQKLRLQPDKVLRGHSGQVWGVVITPDGRLAISGSYDNTLRVWDLHTGVSLNTLYGHTDRIYGVALSPDGRFAVSCSADRTIRIWDLDSNGVCAAILEGHTQGVHSVAVTPDGRRIISGSFDKTVRIWDIKTTQCAAILKEHTDSVFGVAVAPNGRYAVSASGDRTLRVWDLEITRCVATLEGHSGSVDCVVITPDGRSIISGSRDNTVHVWDLESNRALAVLEGHSDAIVGLAVTSDGRWALTSSFDKTVRIWDLLNRTCVKSIGLTKYLMSIAVTPDHHRAIFGSDDNAVWIWNLPANFEIDSVEQKFEYDVFLSYSSKDKKTAHALAKKLRNDGLRVWLSEWVIKLGDSIPLKTSVTLLICMSPAYFESGWSMLEHHISLFIDFPEAQRRFIPLLIEECSLPDIIAQFAYIDWRTASNKAYNKLLAACRNEAAKTGISLAIEETVDQAEMVLKGHHGEVRGVAITSDGKTVVSASYDRTLKVWDLGTGQCRGTFTSHSADVNDLAITPDGATAITVSDDKTLKVWDLATGQCRATFKGHIELVGRVAVTLDGKTVVSSSNDGTLKVWDLSTGQSHTTLKGHTERVLGMAITPDGKTIISGSGDKTLKVWNLTTGQCRATFAGHMGWVYGVTITPDGKMVISSSSDGTLKVWDLETYKCLATFEGHTNSVLDVAITPDGKTIISGSSDNTLKVWNLVTGQCIATLKGHESHVFRVVVAPDGKKIVSGSGDGTIRVWDLDFITQLGRAAEPTTQYVNAKVVLVGDTGVGKTGLSLVLNGKSFKETDSTAGRHIWMFDSQNVKVGINVTQIRETLLWDLAGQPYYRAIHQLHLNEVAVALVVFDACSEIDPLAGVRHWDNALRLAQQRKGISDIPMKKFLVSARNDRGGISIGEDRLQEILKEFGFVGYFETSAKEGWQIKELQEAIKKAIPWEELPEVSSSKLFADIKSFLLDVKQIGTILTSKRQLYDDFVHRNPNMKAKVSNLGDQFETCISLMENRDLIHRLSFGDYVLLQPELLDAYASAIISAAKNDPDGLGSLAEEIVLSGKFFMPKEQKIMDAGQEQLLLYATVEELVRGDLALWENSNDGRYLVLPSQFNRDYEDAPEPKARTLAITFDGSVQSLYATLAVRLGHSGLFTISRTEMWRNAAVFTAKAGGRCGIFLQEFAEARGRLILFFDDHASLETRFHFEEFVLSHAKHYALDGTVEFVRSFVCPDCGNLVPDSYVKLIRERGKTEFHCPCGGTVSLAEPKERVLFRSKVETMDKSADKQRDFDAFVMSANGEMSTRSFQEWVGGDRVALAIVFTDVAGSTASSEEIRNEAMNEIRRAHLAQSRKLMGQFNGREIKTFGDSIMAAFKSANAALDYAMKLQRNTGHHHIQIRAGIHIGPMYVEEGDVFGGTVNFAARMVGSIKGAEIWLSDQAKKGIDVLGTSKYKRLKWQRYDGIAIKGFPSSFTLWSVQKLPIQPNGKAEANVPHEPNKIVPLDVQAVDRDPAAILAPVRIFVCYAYDDERHLKRLDAILDVFEQQHGLVSWRDKRLIAGDEWEEEIRHRLEEMDVFLFIASQTSLVRPYIKDIELKRAMERHKAGEVEIVVMKLEPCACDDDPILGKLQRLAPNFKSITEVSPRSKAWVQIRKDLLTVIQRVREKKKKAAES